MERPIKLLIAGVATFLFTAVAGWFTINASDGWARTLAPDDSRLLAWRPRIEFCKLIVLS